LSYGAGGTEEQMNKEQMNVEGNSMFHFIILTYYYSMCLGCARRSFSEGGVQI
jgi:hypothetical protein